MLILPMSPLVKVYFLCYVKLWTWKEFFLFIVKQEIPHLSSSPRVLIALLWIVIPEPLGRYFPFTHLWARWIAWTACFCVSLVFDSVWEERRCAEIYLSLWCREKLCKIAQSCWCLKKKDRLCFFEPIDLDCVSSPGLQKNSIYGCSESFDFLPAFSFCGCTS